MKFRKLPLAVAIVAAMGSSPVAYAVPETEPNNAFAEIDILAAGVQSYQGELSIGSLVDPADFFALYAPDYYFSNTLSEGAIDTYIINGLQVDDDVQIIINNTPEGASGAAPDTVLGVFDAGVLVQIDDDSSPVGDGLADAIFGAQIQADGSLDFRITGYNTSVDGVGGAIDEFDGTHTEAGDYEVGVYVNSPPLSEGVGIIGIGGFDGEGGEQGPLVDGDIDFVRFTGLTPGELFRVELLPEVPSATDPLPDDQELLSNTGGMIGLFDDSGVLMAADRGWDDGLTVLGGIVPISGEINVAVTGAMDDGGIWSDDGEAFNGTSVLHDTGAYELVLETFNLGTGVDLRDIVVLPDLPGATGNPCNGPDGEAVEGCFGFGGLQVEDGEIVNLDPDVAVGYTFAIVDTGGGTGLFESVLLPAVGDDTEFWIGVAGCGNDDGFAATAGVLYSFLTACSRNVSEFDVLGIDPDEGLDPTDGAAFVTQVTFDQQGTYDVTMTPHTVWVPEAGAVPEPATLALFSVALAGFGFAGRRRERG